MCDARLFPLPRNVIRDLVVWAGEPVHPRVIPYTTGDFVQGPQPAECVRPGEHTHHWDGKGTWWQADDVHW
jgi:hypothetical protein